MSNLTFSTTINFGAAAGSAAAASTHLSAQIDSRPDGLNGGKTSFVPGETAYFLVFSSDNVTVDTPIATAGTISSAAVGAVEQSVDLTFADTNTATLPMPATSITGTTWMGNSLGSLTLGSDGVTVTAGASGIAVARVTFDTTPEAYALASPSTVAGLTDFSILVFISGSLDSA